MCTVRRAVTLDRGRPLQFGLCKILCIQPPLFCLSQTQAIIPICTGYIGIKQLCTGTAGRARYLKAGLLARSHYAYGRSCDRPTERPTDLLQTGCFCSPVCCSKCSVGNKIQRRPAHNPSAVLHIHPFQNLVKIL